MLTVYIAGLIAGICVGGAAGLIFGWRDVHGERSRRIVAERALADARFNYKHIDKWYSEALAIATEAFQPPGRFNAELPMGSHITTAGFRWALDCAIAIDDLATVNWTYERGLTPKQQLAKAVDAEVRYALDPLISRSAQALVDRGKAEAVKVAVAEPKVGERVCNPWKVCGTVVKVNGATVTVRSDSGQYSGIWPLEGLTRPQ